MKRLITVILIVLMVVAAMPTSLFCALAAEQSFVSVRAPQQVVYTGDRDNDRFTVSFDLTLAPNLASVAGYELVFEWDARLLALADDVSVKSEGIYTVNLDHISSGMAKIVVANATDVISAGTLFEVTFYPLTDDADATVSADVHKIIFILCVILIQLFLLATGLISS